MTAERERLLEKIRRVQALAERGVDGEKESAAALLERLMKQYGIDEAEIAEERRETEWFRFRTPLEEMLLNQVIYSIMGDCVTYCRTNGKCKRKHKVVGVDCTPAERLEIEISFEFFNAALQEEEKRFFRAFVQKNNIYPPQEKTTAEGAELEKEEILKLAAMMDGMDVHTRRKMIESGVTT